MTVTLSTSGKKRDTAELLGLCENNSIMFYGSTGREVNALWHR